MSTSKLRLMRFFLPKFYFGIALLVYQKLEAIIFGRIEEISIHDSSDIKTLQIYPDHNFYMPPLNDIEDNQHVASYEAAVPTANVFTINNGIFIPGREEIYTSDLKVLKEISVQKKNPKKGTSKKPLLKYKKLNGRVLCLSLSGVERNYYHFNVEYLARWHLFELSKLDYDYVDFDEKNKFQKQFIDLLDIPKEKLISPMLRECAIKADALIVPSLINNWKYFKMPGGKFHYMKQYLPNWFNKVHQNFRNRSEAPNRIYISRSKADRRKVTNEKEVINLIKKYGFTVFDMEDLNVNNQINLFNNAKIVIAPHGAGLANIVYCSNSFQLLEIFPQNYFDSSFRILAQVLDCKYHYMIGQCPEKSNVHPQKEDIYVDCKKLQKWLTKFILH